MRVGSFATLEKARGASAGCAGTVPRRRGVPSALGKSRGQGQGGRGFRGQVALAQPIPVTPRARRRLDPWPRASAPRVGSLKRVSARTHPDIEDGTDEASAKAGGTPWKVPDPGRRGTLSAPGLCRPGLSAASTRSSSPFGALLQATARLGFEPFEPKPSSRDAAPRPDTSGGAPLPGGTKDVKAQNKNIVKGDAQRPPARAHPRAPHSGDPRTPRRFG